MAIIKVTPETDIRVGQYVCAGRNNSNCTKPRRITRIVGDRLNYEFGGMPMYFLRANIAFMCDSEAEGDAVFDLVHRRAKAMASAKDFGRQAALDEYETQLDSLIASAT